MTYIHVHVSERPDPGGVVECTWATGVELARAALAGSSRQPPATAAERETLRASGGGSDTKGSTYDQLAIGLGARYGLFVTPTLDLPATEIGEGTFLGVQGLYSRLPAHYRRWSTFTGAHSLVVFKLDGILKVCDPLTPWDATWHGEPIAWSVVVAFHTPELLGARVISVHLPTPLDTSTEGPDMAISTRGLTLASSHAITLPDNTPIYNEPGPSVVLGRASGEVPYFGASGAFKAVRVNFGAGSMIGYTDTSATPIAVPVVVPAPAPTHTITVAIDGVTSWTKAV